MGDAESEKHGEPRNQVPDLFILMLGHNWVFIMNEPTAKERKVFKYRKWFRGRVDAFSDTGVMTTMEVNLSVR